ncbi:MAG: hypothetical protein A2902_00475 [Elusimicrobia bacterium RIFCSPLOWO2_01_FULL_64_13]|nr:MAG: hypothetical protein A2902_00475 [Elusimicrobia bacterium RIFCSPLOWO2_01_FULL_64_13]
MTIPKTAALLLSVLFISGGCAGVKKLAKKKPKPERLKVLVLPFDCDEPGICGLIGDGFRDNLANNLEVFDGSSFAVYLSSISKRGATSVPSAQVPLETASPPDPNLPGLAPNPDESGRGMGSAADVPADFYATPEGDMADLVLGREAPRDEPPVEFNQDNFFGELLRKKAFRDAVRRQTGLDYVAAGTAREEKRDAMDGENLKTAETASVKVLELESGSIFLEENFKQGLFEIVAPDRIGKKFAVRLNKEIKDLGKYEKKKAKEEKKAASRSPYP